MARKKNKKQNDEKPTITEPSNLNSAETDNQCNTTSMDENSSLSPSVNNDKRSNRGCFGLRKPSWFTWNIFPKDGQPPTQSLLEVVIYLGFLWFFILLFFDFNRIPTTNFLIQADKIHEARHIKVKDYSGGKLVYIYYQIADLDINLPYSYFSANDISKKCELVVRARTDSILVGDSIIFEENNYSVPIYNSNLSPYMRVIAHQMFSRIVQEGDYFYEFYFANEDFEYDPIMMDFYLPVLFANYAEYEEDPSSPIIYEDLGDIKYIEEMEKFPYYYDILNYILPDSIPVKKVCPFLTKFSYLSSYTSNKYNNMDTIWNSELKSIDERLFDGYVVEASKEGMEQILDSKYLSKVVVSGCYPVYKGDYYNFIDTISFEKSEIINNQSIAEPSYLERYDISQGWYNFELKTSTLDSIALTINFSGATDFYPMGIVPDEIGSNYIKYTNQKKILIIREKGLSFYAKFKELENKQTLRTFFVTAIISGLLIIILSFFILGLYRTLKVFVNYISKNKQK